MIRPGGFHDTRIVLANICDELGYVGIIVPVMLDDGGPVLGQETGVETRLGDVYSNVSFYILHEGLP